MTREETKKMIERVCHLYVTQARKLSAEQLTAMVDTWADEFRNDDYSTIDRAVSSYMRQGKPFMPDVADIINILNSGTRSSDHTPAESERLFRLMASVADILANNKKRTSMIDPGGFKWDADLQRNVYYHAELLVSTTSFTQYDFAQLPEEIQEYVEDIDGLRRIHREIESNEVMARKRFEMALPQIKAEISERKAKLREENRERIAALQQRMLDPKRILRGGAL